MTTVKQGTKTFNVYQPIIDDARYHEINAKGWGNTDWDLAYFNVTSMRDSEDIDHILMAAVEKRLFKHSYIVKAEDIEQTFAITNGMTETGVEWRSGQQKSGSVGDVVIEQGTNNGWACMPFGWYKIDPNTVMWFLTKVLTQRIVGGDEPLVGDQ